MTGHNCPEKQRWFRCILGKEQMHLCDKVFRNNFWVVRSYYYYY